MVVKGGRRLLRELTESGRSSITVSVVFPLPRNRKFPSHLAGLLNFLDLCGSKPETKMFPPVTLKEFTEQEPCCFPMDKVLLTFLSASIRPYLGGVAAIGLVLRQGLYSPACPGT